MTRSAPCASARLIWPGTAKTVWVPDVKTQERRDWFHAHRKAVKRTTQMRNRLLSYLSDNGVRLQKGTPLAKGKAAEELLRKTHRLVSPPMAGH